VRLRRCRRHAKTNHPPANTIVATAAGQTGRGVSRRSYRACHRSIVAWLLAALRSGGPYPLMAIRNMEVHDIVFLADGKHLDWFAEYNARYGEGFKDPEKFDDKSKALFSYYQRAREAYLKKTPQGAQA